MRLRRRTPALIPAIAMLLVSGWLGGKMVYLAKVGVSTDEPTATAQATQQPQEQRHA
jgi:ABC-type transporter Mla subunit MlaD